MLGAAGPQFAQLLPARPSRSGKNAAHGEAALDAVRSSPALPPPGLMSHVPHAAAEKARRATDDTHSQPGSPALVLFLSSTFQTLGYRVI
jgi:hypothetical protein